jgi:tRNA(Met) cytidine acetyltransferase
MARSVRIAAHPALRRRGLARRLVEHVHAAHDVELFGTMFGATPELVRFRREVGYELVRVGVSRGARTGEPAAVMLRPVSERARELVRELREELARSLPTQLALLGEELPIAPALAESLAVGLPPPRPLTREETRAAVARYVESTRPFDAAAYAISAFVAEHEPALADLPPATAALLRARALEGRRWEDAARFAGHPSVASAMRAMRPAVGALLERVG